MERSNFQDLQFQTQWRFSYQIEVASTWHLWNWIAKSWWALLTSFYYFHSFQKGYFTIWLFNWVQILLSISVWFCLSQYSWKHFQSNQALLSEELSWKVCDLWGCKLWVNAKALFMIKIPFDFSIWWTSLWQWHTM